MPWRGAYLVQPGSIDNPPFSGGRPATLAAILGLWGPIPPTLFQPRFFVQGQTVDAPPVVSRATLAEIIGQWFPDGPPQVLRRYLAQGLQIDDPPLRGGRPSLWQILDAWQPGPPKPQTGAHVPLVVSAVPVDMPPFGQRNELAWLFCMEEPWRSPLLYRRLLLPQTAAAVGPVFVVITSEGITVAGIE
jgi:hypothetical protein